MAKQEQLYPAFITRSDDDQEPVLQQVDIFNLPYDKFDEQSPLIIPEDVDMGKSKNRKWPDLSNVIIFGDLDCSNFTITSETIFPCKFKRLICKFSIKDLDVLIGLLPSGVKSVVVRTALMNNIKNNKDNALDCARRFIEAYPDITVTDTKQTLSDILHGLDCAVVPSVQQISDAKKTTAENFKIKTDKWLDSHELAIHCAVLSDKIAALSEDIRSRYIRMARSSKLGLNIKTEYLKRPSDGELVLCVHVDSVSTIVDYILGYLFEQEQAIALLKSVPKYDNNDVLTEKRTDTIASLPDNQKIFFGADEVQQIDIKKYISKSAWAQIRGKCACSATELLRILNDIECINVDPASTKGASVVYVQNGSVQKSRTVKFKSVHCLCQGFGNKDNRARIVWGISGNTFICQKFFAEHATNYDYQRYIRDLDIDASALDLSEFFYVPDLINDLSGGREDASDDNLLISDSGVSHPLPIDSAPTKNTVDHSGEFPTINKSAPTPKEKRRSVPYKKVSPMTSNENTKNTETKKQSTDWVDLYSLNHSIIQQYENLQKMQSTILSQMISETDTEKMIQMNHDLQVVLQNKSKCETTLRQLKDINKSLLDIQNGFNLQRTK